MGGEAAGALESRGRSTRFEFMPLAMGAWVLGVVVAGLMLVCCLIVLVAAQNITGGPTGAGWPDWGLALTGVASLLFAVFVGVWLFRLRRWIGIKGDPEDQQTIRRKRRFFVGGSMASYVPLVPCICLLLVALANST